MRARHDMCSGGLVSKPQGEPRSKPAYNINFIQFLRSRVFGWELMSRALRALTLSKQQSTTKTRDGKEKTVGKWLCHCLQPSHQLDWSRTQAGKNENGDQLPGPRGEKWWRDRGKHNGEQNRQQAGQIMAGNEKTTGNTTAAKGGLLQASRLQVTATGKTQRVSTSKWEMVCIWMYMMGK